MLNISIRTIPHQNQKYDSAGMWFYKEDEAGTKTIFEISEMEHEDYEFLVALHEFIEQYLCKKDGVTQNQVDIFDTTYRGNFADDPGHDPKAPYHKQHEYAMVIEKLLAKRLGVKWRAYNKAFEKLEWKEKT